MFIFIIIPNFDLYNINICKRNKKKNIIKINGTFIVNKGVEMIMELPESIKELHAFGDTVTEEIEFIEVCTSSPRFSDSIGLPVFIVTGFLPKITKKLYENLIYPAFEARLPENIESIEHVARTLVQVNSITFLRYYFLFMFSFGNPNGICICKPLNEHLFSKQFW